MSVQNTKSTSNTKKHYLQVTAPLVRQHDWTTTIHKQLILSLPKIILYTVIYCMCVHAHACAHTLTLQIFYFGIIFAML